MTNRTFKLIRLYLGFNQDQYAKYIGVAYSSVCEIESGNRAVSDYIQSKLAKKFDPDDGFDTFVERTRKLSL